MLRRGGITNRATPAPPLIIGTVHAALIRGPQLSGFAAGAEQRRNCDGWLWPSVKHSFPSIVTNTPIESPSERPATYAEYGPDDDDTTTTSECSGSMTTLRR